MTLSLEAIDVLDAEVTFILKIIRKQLERVMGGQDSLKTVSEGIVD